MKKIISLVLGMSILFMSVIPSAYADDYLTGDGTAENPYVITSEAEFNMIRNQPDAYYSLKADIVLSDNYIPFEFSGSLVGDTAENPYSITVNLSSNSSYTSPLGLFSVIKNAELKNLVLKGKVSGYAYVGGFFGKVADDSQSEILENLINTAQITGKGTYIGGIGAASGENTSATKLVNKGYVKGSGYTGGIFALGYDLTACANNGLVISDGDYAGGIIAELKGKISGSYNSGNVSGYGYTGGIAGAVSETNTIIENCFNTGKVTSLATGANSCGGILGGIKRLPDINVILNNCYNAGDVADPFYISSQYIPYDETNYIKLNNCYYNAEADSDIDGLYSFSNFSGLSGKLSSSFTDSDRYGLAALNNIAYAEYTSPEYEDDEVDSLPDKEIKTEVIKEAELLKALGTIDAVTDFDKKVTRGEFADLISRVFLYNIEFKKDNAENVFYDVGPSYMYYDGVKVITDLGIMSQDGYNRFYPDREISGNEAVTALIRALGYEVYAKAQGEYPTGYLYEAKQIGLLKGLDNVNSSAIDMKTAVKLLYNALFVNTVTTSGIDENGGNKIQIHSDSVYLDYIHSVYKYDAVLTDNGYINSSALSPASGKVEITELKSGKVKQVEADDKISSYFGQRMEIFVRENEDIYPEVVCFSTSSYTHVTVLNGREITNLTSEGIFYEVEGDSQNNKLCFDSSKRPIVYINGNKSIGYQKSDFTSKNSLVYAIDNNSDNYIDYINIFKFDYEVIAGVIDSEKLIYPYSGSAHDMNLDTEKNIYTFILGSEVKELSNISQGNVISVAKSNITHNGKMVYYLSVSKNKVEGTYDAKGDGYITVSGKDYYISEMMRNTYINYESQMDFSLNITVFINAMGEIAFISSGEVMGKQYGFILATGFTSEYEKRGVVKLLDSTGSVNTFYLSEKVKKEGTRVTDIEAFVLTDLGTLNDSLIVYELNDKNEIINVEFAKIISTNEAENITNFTLRKHITVSSQYSGVTLGGIGAKDTLVFVVPSDYDKDGSNCIVRKNYFSRGSAYSNVKFFDVGQNGIAKVALYQPEKLEGKFNSKQHRTYIFKKIVSSYDENEGEIKKIYYYDMGVEKSVLVSNDWEPVELNSGITISNLNTLKPGDLFCFETNTNDMAEKIALMYKSSDFFNSGDGVWYTGGDGTGNNYTLSIFEGTLQYKSGTMMTVRFPLTEYNVEPFSYTSGTIGIYLVNTSNESIHVVDESYLNASNFLTGDIGVSAVYVASKNQLMEVIIYE